MSATEPIQPRDKVQRPDTAGQHLARHREELPSNSRFPHDVERIQPPPADPRAAPRPVAGINRHNTVPSRPTWEFNALPAQGAPRLGSDAPRRDGRTNDAERSPATHKIARKPVAGPSRPSAPVNAPPSPPPSSSLCPPPSPPFTPLPDVDVMLKAAKDKRPVTIMVQAEQRTPFAAPLLQAFEESYRQAHLGPAHLHRSHTVATSVPRQTAPEVMGTETLRPHRKLPQQADVGPPLSPTRPLARSNAQKRTNDQRPSLGQTTKPLPPLPTEEPRDRATQFAAPQARRRVQIRHLESEARRPATAMPQTTTHRSVRPATAQPIQPQRPSGSLGFPGTFEEVDETWGQPGKFRERFDRSPKGSR